MRLPRKAVEAEAVVPIISTLDREIQQAVRRPMLLDDGTDALSPGSVHPFLFDDLIVFTL